MCPPYSRFAPQGVDSPPQRTRGFTIVELLTVVAVMAILAAIAAPSLSQLLATMRVKNASFDFYTSLMAARNEALTRNTTVAITPVTADSWNTGWNVTASSGAATLKTQGALPGVVFSVSSGSVPASISYNNAGRLITAISPIQLGATDVPTATKRCLTLGLSGRPVTTQGACP